VLWEQKKSPARSIRMGARFLQRDHPSFFCAIGAAGSVGPVQIRFSATNGTKTAGIPAALI